MGVLKCLVAVALAVAVLAGCSPAGPTHDKAWYAGNAADRASELTACQNDPGRLRNTPNCINAQAADADAHAAHFYETPKADPRVHAPGRL